VVKGFLSSPRRRRRFFTFGSAAIVVGLVAFAMVHWSNTSHVHYAKTRPGKPTVLANPVHADFRVAKREGVMRVAAEFVNTAVRRHNVAVSYDLTTPTLHSGYTRKTWSTEDIPVQPYPLDSARYKLMGSFTDSVWLEVAVYPDRKHKSVPAAVFDLTLKPFAGSGHAHRWLVDSWAPASYQGVPSGPLGSDKGPLGATSNVEYKSGLSNVWLLVPISGFIVGFCLLIGLAARGWYRNNRAVKSYREHSL
jgi:hypothetical protein